MSSFLDTIFEPEGEALIDLPEHAKAGDPLRRATILRRIGSNTFSGHVEEIEEGAFTRERLYRIRYDDGDIEHFVKEQVLRHAAHRVVLVTCHHMCDSDNFPTYACRNMSGELLVEVPTSGLVFAELVDLLADSLDVPWQWVRILTPDGNIMNEMDLNEADDDFNEWSSAFLVKRRCSSQTYQPNFL